jgi:uncharacterized integral membrane protein
MVNEIRQNTSDFLRSIFIWTVFSFALNYIFELLNINYFVLYLLIPGITFFTFLIYHLLKTKRFLSYWSFFISIAIISIVFHLFRVAKLRFIELNYMDDDFYRTLVMFIASLAVSSVLYLVSYFIKRIYKA